MFIRVKIYSLFTRFSMALEHSLHFLLIPLILTLLLCNLLIFSILDGNNGFILPLLLAIALAGMGLFIRKLITEFRILSPKSARLQLERHSGIAVGTLDFLKDSPTHTLEKHGKVLWHKQQQWAREQLRSLKLKFPNFNNLLKGDAYALLSLVLLGLLAGFFIEGKPGLKNITAVLKPIGLSGADDVIISAWLTLPDYMGGKRFRLFTEKEAVITKVPSGSNLSLETQGFSFAPRLYANNSSYSLNNLENNRHNASVWLTSGAKVQVRGFWRNTYASTDLSVIPDAPPQVKITATPVLLKNGQIKITYQASDDFGLKKLKLVGFVKDNTGNEKFTREHEISVPASSTVDDSASIQVSSARWWGQLVHLKLMTYDVKGQSASSGNVTLQLPELQLKHPFAIKLAWQKKLLMAEGADLLAGAENISGLSTLVNEYNADKKVFLALRANAYRLARARDNTDKQQSLDLLTDIIAYVENAGKGDKGDYARTLSRLLEAMKNGDKLRDVAMLAARLNAQISQSLMDAGVKVIDTKDIPPQLLNKVETVQGALQRILNLYATGAREEAMRMLEQMRKSLDKAASEPDNPVLEQQMMEALQALSGIKELATEQKQLSDTLFSSRDDKAKLMSLAENQKWLETKLDKIASQIEQGGLKKCSGLSASKSDMKNAGNAASTGRGKQASTSALSAYEELQKMLKQAEQDFAEKYGSQFILNGMGEQQGGQGTNPSGHVDMPDKFKVERSREILEELYRRANDQSRPRPELEYLERLLEGY